MIIRPGHNVWKETTAHAAGLLIDAEDYYLAFYRAVQSAQRYVLMSGWQFDSGVELLRGEDAAGAPEVRFLKYLNGLCGQRPDLQVYILAWDFHLVLAAERQWMQRVIFHWLTNSRLRFRFDKAPIAGGSHHQKFVVVDGALAFLGGMDVCECRWDDRCHRATNPWRTSRGKPVKPYHDVQVYVAGGDAPQALEALFVERWARAGGTPLSLPPADPTAASAIPERGALALDPGRVALSRTDPRTDGETVREIAHLFVDAIDAAERLIYVETQYFSSQRLYAALVRRMRAAGRRKLEIVIVVNERAEALKEEVAVGLRQAKILDGLRRAVAGTGHALGIYWARCDGATDATFQATYLHSKVVIVDDRFLSVGSANFTNRSMWLDSELHASWETVADAAGGPALIRSIRRVRVSLLAEHGGLSGARAIRPLVAIPGLVGRLHALAARPGARLQRHGPLTDAQVTMLGLIDPQALPFDPRRPEIGDHAGGDEPTDEARPRLLPPIGRPLRAAWRRLGRARS